MLHRKFTGIWTGDGLLIMKRLLFWSLSSDQGWIGNGMWYRSILLQNWLLEIIQNKDGTFVPSPDTVIHPMSNMSKRNIIYNKYPVSSCVSNQFVPLIHLSSLFVVVVSLLGVISYNDHFHLCHQFNVTYFFASLLWDDIVI